MILPIIHNSIFIIIIVINYTKGATSLPLEQSIEFSGGII